MVTHRVVEEHGDNAGDQTDLDAHGSAASSDEGRTLPAVAIIPGGERKKRTREGTTARATIAWRRAQERAIPSSPEASPMRRRRRAEGPLDRLHGEDSSALALQASDGHVEHGDGAEQAAAGQNAQKGGALADVVPSERKEDQGGRGDHHGRPGHRRGARSGGRSSSPGPGSGPRPWRLRPQVTCCAKKSMLKATTIVYGMKK